MGTIDPESAPLHSQGPDAAPRAATRPARALIGWMSPEQAQRALMGSMAVGPVSLDAVRKDRGAKAARARRSGFSQGDVVQEAPTELRDYIASFMPTAPNFRDEGWRVAVVDLAQVVAAQPIVHLDRGPDLDQIQPDDLRSIINITLPMPTQVTLPAQFDEAQKAWTIASDNPNLRILGSWATPIDNAGLLGFGFAIGVVPSYMQVASFRGRHILRDGYHRALALLRHGITKAPAFVRDFGPDEDCIPPGLLPPATYLGDQPPLLPDYLDDTVAAQVEIPSTRRIIALHGVELNPAA